MRVAAPGPTIRVMFAVAVLALAPAAGIAQTAQAPKPVPPVVQPRGPAQPEKPTVTAAAPVQPHPPVAPSGDKPAVNPPKLPRFESLRSNEVNLRSGPGKRYRIDWVYKRSELPVRIEREFEHWRAVRDADGIEGWVNQANLTARRTFIVQGGDATIRDDPDDKASAVAILKPGVIGRIKSCAKDSDWCRVQIAGHNGYLRRAQFWGTLPNEDIPP